MGLCVCKAPEDYLRFYQTNKDKQVFIASDIVLVSIEKILIFLGFLSLILPRNIFSFGFLNLFLQDSPSLWEGRYLFVSCDRDQVICHILWNFFLFKCFPDIPWCIELSKKKAKLFSVKKTHKSIFDWLTINLSVSISLPYCRTKWVKVVVLAIFNPDPFRVS